MIVNVNYQNTTSDLSVSPEAFGMISRVQFHQNSYDISVKDLGNDRCYYSHFLIGTRVTELVNVRTRARTCFYFYPNMGKRKKDR